MCNEAPPEFSQTENFSSENPFAGMEGRPASAALPPTKNISVTFGSMGSTIMAVGSASNTELSHFVRRFARETHQEPVHIDCAPAEHDLVLDHLQSTSSLFGSVYSTSMVYCRRCPYHYFPEPPMKDNTQ